MNSKLSNLVNNYKMPDEAIELLQKAKLVFIVGISGAGKDTILKELLKTGQYRLIVSHTTRKPRENQGVLEKDGQDYHFIDEDEAARMLESGEFIEAKRYSDNIYGTSLAEVEKAYKEGKVAISDIEVQGVAEYMKVASNVTPIFILPPDFDTWQRRLQARYKVQQPDPEDINRRMQTAKKELLEALSKDYFEFVINDHLDRAVAAVEDISNGHRSTERNELARKVASDILQQL